MPNRLSCIGAAAVRGAPSPLIDLTGQSPLPRLLAALRTRDAAAALQALAQWDATSPAPAAVRLDGAETLLHFAVRSHAAADVLNGLLIMGVDPRATDLGGSTALHLACDGAVRSPAATIQRLIGEGGATLREQPDAHGRTALARAAEGGHYEAVVVLLACGAMVHITDTVGGTPLHGAAARGHASVVAKLLEAGALADARNQSGVTPLMLAAREGRLDVARMLLQEGADVNGKDTIQATALMYAAANGRAEVADLLLARGAAWSARTEYGWTSLTLAAYAGDRTMVMTLMAHGADLNARDGNGRNAWEVAMLRGGMALANEILGLAGPPFPDGATRAMP